MPFPLPLWKTLEWLPGLTALPDVWLQYLGHNHDHFKNLCLQPSQHLPSHVPCPRECGCRHFIVFRHDKTAAVGICRCQPQTCPDIPLTIEQITPLVVDWHRLGHAISRALNCTPIIADLQPANTKQIGSWSAHAVPLILTIHYDEIQFRSAVAELAASIHRPFILLAPTTTLLDAPCLSYLHDAGAVFSDLQSTLGFDPAGHLVALKPPAQLFSAFHSTPSALSLQPSAFPRFSLTKHLGVWHLIFDGQEAFIRHERGLFYVAWLLYHPDECPIHAIDLMAKIPELYRQQLGLPALTDPATGKSITLESGARLQERSLALDDRQSMRALYKKQRQLEALLDSDDASEPEKAEALRELEQIYDWQRHHARTSRDAARKIADTVQKAIRRLKHNLLKSADQTTPPNQALSDFSNHIANCILASPANHPKPTQTTPRPLPQTGFIYNIPSQISWTP